ncbi:LytTR family transcriptional regulator [Amycolatopsis coloradensis]|uniref:LytTR family transcriptional regulator n=1 Tax=Amycolatopsis coloradensis TaxID=76021 RepID=A0A1R0KHV0_9PSEU|nr:LCP family protein [Amycolatopsis coloradensis]OLZ45315.1 LytTR family transcriptional regulator [Amycolatopsis coloradensis]
MHKLGKVLVAALAVAVFSGTAYGYSTVSSLDGITREDVIESPDPGERPADGSLDILLVGRDSRTDDNGNPLSPEMLRELRVGANGDDLTDTLIVLRIPNGQKAVKAFSIPRDSWVAEPGTKDKTKINGIFGHAKFASASAQREAGKTDKAEIDKVAITAARKATLKAVEDLTGVKIDHFAEVNLQSFYDISKAVGGVEVCLNRATKDRKSGADFPAGKQTIQGADALAFVRQREDLPRSDLDRVRRQQVFLAGLAKQVLSAGTLANPARVSELIDAVKRSVVLDGSWDLFDFVRQMQGVSGGGIAFDTIPVVNPDYRYNPKQPTATAVQVDPAQVRAFAASLIGAQPTTPQAPPAGPKVDVVNASGKDGLAARVSDVLAEKGFGKGEMTAEAGRRTSVVRFSDASGPATEIAKLLGGLETQKADSVAAGHVQVVLGQVYKGPGVSAGGGAAGVRTDQPITSDDTGCIN